MHSAAGGHVDCVGNCSCRPELWLEQRLGHADHAVEQIVLRVALMLLRLYPILEGAIDLLVLLCFQSVHGHVAISLPVEMQTMVSNVSK